MKRKFVRCSSLVNRNAVRRETVDGVEHIIVSSFTLPDNIVMNGVFYPAEEIEKSFASLNRTLAPVEHPTNSDGRFLSANDPTAIHQFYAGAFNDNAERVDGRIRVDKIINVQEALKTERGRRLLDRVNELETSDDPRPIHTSTGIFLDIRELDEPATNDDGLEYQAVASNMFIDHDAILLDSVGAAQPSQGVGMAVNSRGERVDTEHYVLEPVRSDVNPKDSRVGKLNQTGLSFRNVMEQLETEIRGRVNADWLYAVDLFDNVIIFETNEGLFQFLYEVENDIARVIGNPAEVRRNISYEPITQNEDTMMRDAIINALKEAGRYKENMSDDDAIAAYNSLIKGDGGESENDDTPAAAVSNQQQDANNADPIATAVNEAVRPLQEKIDSLTAAKDQDEDAKKTALVNEITSSKKYEGLTEDMLKAMPVETLDIMATNTRSGVGLAPGNPTANVGEIANVPTELPGAKGA